MLVGQSYRQFSTRNVLRWIFESGERTRERSFNFFLDATPTCRQMQTFFLEILPLASLPCRVSSVRTRSSVTRAIIFNQRTQKIATSFPKVTISTCLSTVSFTLQRNDGTSSISGYLARELHCISFRWYLSPKWYRRCIPRKTLRRQRIVARGRMG